MTSPSDLEKRVQELEQEMSRLRGRGMRSVRYTSTAAIGNIPLVSIALGPDLAKGQWRGHARGIIAVGDRATGVIAVGGLATGGICFGGLSLGLVSFGGLALGLASFGGLALGVLLAIGGLAVGGAALGGGAVGRVAIGGGAAGEYACGGGAFGAHVIDARGSDPEAERFFREHGIEWLCPPEARRPRRSAPARPPEAPPDR